MNTTELESNCTVIPCQVLINAWPEFEISLSNHCIFAHTIYFHLVFSNTIDEYESNVIMQLDFNPEAWPYNSELWIQASLHTIMLIRIQLIKIKLNRNTKVRNGNSEPNRQQLNYNNSVTWMNNPRIKVKKPPW